MPYMSHDFYFTDMTTAEAEGYGEIQGESLWAHMASNAEAARHAGPGATADGAE